MKKTFIIIGIMILAFSLIACGNANVANEPEEVVAETENTEETENVSETTTEEATEPAEENTSSDELAVGQLIPNYQLTTLEGDTVSLHDYQGNILVLNFWASW